MTERDKLDMLVNMNTYIETLADALQGDKKAAAKICLTQIKREVEALGRTLEAEILLKKELKE